MLLRHVQTLTVALVALWVGVIALGNVTDYASNFAFVRHVLSMDTIFPESTLSWRALTHPVVHHVVYASIIAAEVVIAVLCGWGAVVLFRCREDPAAFSRGKSMAVAGYVLALVLWLGGFVIVGGEWFAMWQSETWNGLDAAFRMVVVVTLFLLLLLKEEGAPAVEQEARVAEDAPALEEVSAGEERAGDSELSST